MGIIKHSEITENVVSTTFIEFDDVDNDRNLISTNRFATQNNWVPIKRCDTSIFIGNSSGSLSIKRTQFPIRLSWACTMYEVQGLTIPQAVVSFDLEKQKTFKEGQIYVALGRIKNLEGLFLTGYFQRDAIKANIEATNKYERLNNEALFVPPAILTVSPRTLTLTLLNTRSLRKHAIDITSDSRLTESDVLFLTETQLADAENVTNIHHLLNDFSVVFNNSNFCFSSVTIAYRSSVQI